MSTVEMYLAAQISGLMYKCPSADMLYSKSTGLINNDEYNDRVYLDELGCSFDELMAYEWFVADDFMTIAEAEKKLGVKIIRD